MQRNLENGRPDRNKCNARPEITESGFERKRAVQKVDRKHRAETVADHQNFAKIRAAHRVGEFLREPVKALLQHGTVVMHIGTSENPVIEELGKLKQTPKALDERNQRRNARYDAEHRGPAQLRSYDGSEASDNSQQREEQQRIKKEKSIAPVRAQVAPERTGRDELDKGQQAKRNALPHRAAGDGIHDVVPADELKAGVDAPIRT